MITVLSLHFLEFVSQVSVCCMHGCFIMEAGAKIIHVYLVSSNDSCLITEERFLSLTFRLLYTWDMSQSMWCLISSPAYYWMA